MPDKYFLSASQTFMSGADLMTSVRGERVLWSGHCAVAEYAFDEPASLPRWTLAEETEVVVTEDRVLYANFAAQSAGELRWPWPQHLRVQPGNRDTGRSATVTQIQLVCGGPDGNFPALVFAGGDLTTVADADRLANVLRQAIARYRVEHAGQLGLPAPQARMLSRLVIGPEFSNYQGGEGQTVSLLGAVPIDQPASDQPEFGQPEFGQPEFGQPEFGQPEFDQPVPGLYGDEEPFLDEYFSAGYVAGAADLTHFDSADSTGTGYGPAGTSYASASAGYGQAAEQPALPAPIPVGSIPVAPIPVAPIPVAPVPVAPVPGQAVEWVSGARPGRDADATRAWQAQRAEAAAQNAQPDLASRAADLAARVASLVSGGTRLDEPLARYETETTNLSAFLNPPDDQSSGERSSFDGPSSDDLGRAEMVRRTAARFAGNSARARSSAPRRADDEIGATSRGSHRNG
jgi:hypothetical protein